MKFTLLGILLLLASVTRADTVTYDITGVSSSGIPCSSCPSFSFGMQVSGTTETVNAPGAVNSGPVLDVTSVTGLFDGQYEINLVQPSNAGYNGYWDCYCDENWLVGGYLPLGGFLNLTTDGIPFRFFFDSNGLILLETESVNQLFVNETSVTWNAVAAPEPSTLLLLAAGLPMLWWKHARIAHLD